LRVKLVMKIQIHNLFNLGIILWVIYNILPLIDVILGNDVAVNLEGYNTSFTSEKDLLVTIALASLWLAGFVIFKGRNQNVATLKKSNYKVNFWMSVTTIVVSIVVTVSYVKIFGEYSRAEKYLVTSSSSMANIINASKTVSSYWLILVIFYAKKKNVIVISILTFLLLNFATGSRLPFVILIICLAKKYTLKIPVIKLITCGFLLIFVMQQYKSVWFLAKNQRYAEIPTALWQNISPSVSSFEPANTFALLHYCSLSPNLNFGMSYIYGIVYSFSPSLAKNIMNERLTTTTIWELNREKVLKGGGIGFSGIGEAYINFGYIGPFLIGIICFVCVTKIEKTNSFFLYLMILTAVLMYFRSDFASLARNRIVIPAFSVISFIIVNKLITEFKLVQNQTKS